MIYLQRLYHLQLLSCSLFCSVLNLNHITMSSLYIHIPFCDYKCEYCSFHVLETHNMKDPDSIKRQYLDALKREIDEKVSVMSSLYTIYIGGGTPTSLGAD